MRYHRAMIGPGGSLVGLGQAARQTRRAAGMAEFKERVFVFTGAAFEAALRDWEAEQIAAYPHREELIRVTALAMRDFLESAAVRRHRMTLKGETES